MEIKNRYQLLDKLWEITDQYGYIPEHEIEKICQQLDISKIEIDGIISFYHFFHKQPRGKYTIYLNNSIVSKHKGYNKVKTAFEDAIGTTIGHVGVRGEFGLYETSCIGLSDQEPSALINYMPFTNLTPQRAHKLIFELKAGKSLEEICDQVEEHIQYTPDADKSIFFRNYEMGASIEKLKSISQEEVIEEMKSANLVGMGGAFFPAYIKWNGCKNQKEKEKYIVCNADEGEPGTFKDRVILQRLPGLMIEGMIIAGYAVGATTGIIYLRAEYRYLQKRLQSLIDVFYNKGFLGKSILGIKGFDFDLRIQLGAGAYVCGEETALLQSMEGKRGEPRAKIYFPVERGFLNKPTIVNNVETFCGAARILELGASTILRNGTKESPGNKILSISGDCLKPGIYEVEWGISLDEVLFLCEAVDAHIIQISGPSGELVSIKEKDRKLSLQDLRCGGSIMIFNSKRDLLKILNNYNHFFTHESCGICTPCRAGNFIISKQLKKISRGLADSKDMTNLIEWSKIMKYSSRCGLGQTAPNSIMDAVSKYPEYFSKIVEQEDLSLNRRFDIERAVREYDYTVAKNKIH